MHSKFFQTSTALACFSWVMINLGLSDLGSCGKYSDAFEREVSSGCQKLHCRPHEYGRQKTRGVSSTYSREVLGYSEDSYGGKTEHFKYVENKYAYEGHMPSDIKCLCCRRSLKDLTYPNFPAIGGPTVRIETKGNRKILKVDIHKTNSRICENPRLDKDMAVVWKAAYNELKWTNFEWSNLEILWRHARLLDEKSGENGDSINLKVILNDHNHKCCCLVQ